MRHNTPIITVLLLFLLNLSVLFLTGCGPKTTKPVVETSTPEADVYAKELYQAGDFYAAAEEYLRLANSEPGNAINYQLNAADALIKNQEIDRAQQIISLLTLEKLSAVQAFLKIIYEAQILLTKNEVEAAYTLLGINTPSAMPKPALAKFYETRATVLQQKKEYFAAASDRILLNSYLQYAQDISDNYQQLWRNLAHLSLAEINNHRAASTGTIIPWLELATINKTLLQNTADLEIAIDTWQQRYPDHPALVDIVPTIISHSIQLAKKPSQIALLLPFNGKYSNVSHVIRDGFMAAWYQSRDDKPIIRIYNADDENIIEKYTQAITEGADFIVGPLQKAAISKLIEQGDITVTTLVLNQYETESDHANLTLSPFPSIVQFGLSPEDEAKQVAERAWFDGHARAITISTADDRSQRIQDAFSSHWQQLGGVTLEHINIGQDVRQLAEPVRRVLNIDQSEQRAKILRSKLQRSLKTEVRRRQDVDLIFMTVPPAIARQLVPQLRFNGIKDVGLYSVSNLFTGNVDTRKDNDINGVLFVDMPWLIHPENEYSSLKRMAERYWKPEHSAYKRFYAFGIDAYNLISHLTELNLEPSQQYSGQTGYLSIDSQGRIQRRQIWAQFIEGKPELVDTAISN